MLSEEKPSDQDMYQEADQELCDSDGWDCQVVTQISQR